MLGGAGIGVRDPHAVGQQSTGSGDPSFDVATKAVHDVVDGVALGVEYYSGLGKLAKTLPSYLQENTLYAVMDWDRKPFAFNFGVGKGLNGATDKWTVKAIIEVPFK